MIRFTKRSSITLPLQAGHKHSIRCPLVNNKTSAQMSFSSQPVTIKDAHVITEIFQDAFADDHILKYISPNTPKDVQFQTDLEFFSRLLDRDPAFGGKVIKVIDESTGYLRSLLKVFVLPRTDLEMSGSRSRLQDG